MFPKGRKTLLLLILPSPLVRFSAVTSHPHCLQCRLLSMPFCFTAALSCSVGTGGLVGVGVWVRGTSGKDRAGPSNASFLRVAEASTPVPGWVRLERWLQEEGQRALWRRCPGWLRPQTTKPHPPHPCPQTAPTGPCSQVPAWRDAERGWSGDRVGNGGTGGGMEGNRHRDPRRLGQMQTLRTEGSREREKDPGQETQGQTQQGQSLCPCP